MDITRAQRALQSAGLAPTPLVEVFASPYLKSRVLLKLESLQPTGSFKVRGALNALSALPADTTLVTTASTGNHALAFCFALNRLKSRLPESLAAEIYLPVAVAEYKRKKLETAAAESAGRITLKYVEGDCGIAEMHARKAAEEAKSGFAKYVSPYNDELIAAGQGTIGQEIQNQLERDFGVEGGLKDVKRIYVPVGGGGLISGIAVAAKSLNPKIEIVGFQPVVNSCFAESIVAGRILTHGEFRNEPTIAEAVGGAVEPGSVTCEYCKSLVDRWELVEEDEIRNALSFAKNHFGIIMEGAAGLALSTCLREQSDRSDPTDLSISIVCGRNLSPTSS